eukprot:811048_1
MYKSTTITIGLVIVFISSVVKLFEITDWNLLNSMNENMVLGYAGIQLSSLAFCLNSAESLLDVSSGHIDEDKYQKQSIYAILYSLYEYLGTIKSDKNVQYRFTFNTWGIASQPSLFNSSDPERFGKTAYKSLILFDETQRLITSKLKNNDKLKILEVGCGTGAGANLITSEIKREFMGIEIEYFALDMQLAAIQICRDIHESEALKCVQGNGKHLPFDNDTFDVVVISETHIAEIDIDEETDTIINQIVRVLKNEGLFVWGNALFTETWNDIIRYLPTKQFKSCGVKNVTKGAIRAREEDKERVEEMWRTVVDQMVLFQWYSKCEHFIKQLLFNFYRHPGTNLFNTMVNGTDSYMQICNQIQK